MTVVELLIKSKGGKHLRLIPHPFKVTEMVKVGRFRFKEVTKIVMKRTELQFYLNGMHSFIFDEEKLDGVYYDSVRALEKRLDLLASL